MPDPLAPQPPQPPQAPPSPPISEWEFDALKQSVRSNSLLAHAALVGLIVVLATVNVLLFQQVSLLRRQLADMSGSSNRMIGFLAHHQTNGVPNFVRFLQRMDQFALKDPEFAKVMARYPRMLPPGGSPTSEGQPIQY